MKPKFFRSPLHCARLANDGLLYVCDRGNNRVQVFKASEAGKPCANPDGEVGKCGFVGEIHVAPQSIGGTSGTVNFSTDAKQSCMYVADLVNDVIYVDQPAEPDRAHAHRRRRPPGRPVPLAARGGDDSDGNMYIGEVDGAARMQKFLRYGATGCSGTGSAEVGKYLVQ